VTPFSVKVSVLPVPPPSNRALPTSELSSLPLGPHGVLSRAAVVLLSVALSESRSFVIDPIPSRFLRWNKIFFGFIGGIRVGMLEVEVRRVVMVMAVQRELLVASSSR